MTILLDITTNFKDWLSCDWNSISDFSLWFAQGIAYLIALMMVGAVIALIGMMFKRDKFGRELREGCLAYIAVFSVPVVVGLFFGLCSRDKKDESTTHAFVSHEPSTSSSHPWSDNHLDKQAIEDVEWDDTVWICTSGSSKRFHSTLACPGMQNCMDGEDAITREEAEDLGRTHCLRCYY